MWLPIQPHQKTLFDSSMFSHVAMFVTCLDPAPASRSKFGPSVFEPEVFRKQIYCIEESTCDIFGTFRSPSQWSDTPIFIRSPGIVPPLALSGYDPGPNVRSGVGITSRFYSLKRCFEVKQNEHYFNETKMVIKVRGEIAWLSPVCRILWLTFRSPR